MSSLNDSSLELLCALRQFTKVVIHLPSQYENIRQTLQVGRVSVPFQSCVSLQQGL